MIYLVDLLISALFDINIFGDALFRIFNSLGISYIGQDKIWNYINKMVCHNHGKCGVSSLRRSIPERCGLGRPTQVGDSAT